MYKGDFSAGSIVDMLFTSLGGGVPATLGGTPAVSIYKDNSLVQASAGVTLGVDHDGITGLNHIRVDTSADGTFYSAGSTFHVVLTTGSVAGVSWVGYVFGSFSLRARSLEAVMSRLGAPAGASVSADIAAVQADTDNIQTRLPAALVSGRMDSSVGAMAANTVTASALAADAGAEIADAVCDEILADHTVPGSLAEGIATAASSGGESIAEDLAAIRTKTDLISAGGVTLQTPFNPITGKLTLTRGDDYPAEHAGRIPAFTSSDWPDLTDAQEIRMTVRVRNPQTGEGEDVIFTLLDTEAERIAGDEEQSVTFEPLHAPDGSPATNEQVGGTDDLTPGNNTGVWDVQAILEDGTIKTLAKGKVDVIEDETR